MLRLPESVHTVIPTFHPAYALRGMPQMLPSIFGALRRAKTRSAFPSGPLAGPERQIQTLLYPTPDELRIYARGAQVVAVDVETPRDDHKKITICGLSAGPMSGTAYPWSGEYIDITREIMADPQIVKVGHNFAFDLVAFKGFGVEGRWPVANTIEAEALLRPPFKEAKKRRWHALSSCVAWHFDGIPYWKEPETAATKALYRVMFPDVPEGLYPFLYCALDCVYTRMLWLAQREKLRTRGMLRTFTEYVAPAGLALADMSYRGIPVDLKRRDELLAYLETRIKEAKDTIRDFTQDYHERRLAALRHACDSALELIDHEIDTHPLFSANPGPNTPGDGPATELRPCGTHPEYRGLTKRLKCTGCAAVYRGSGSLRRKVKELRTKLSGTRQRIKNLGPEFKAGSDDHWRWLLFDEQALALVPTAFTDKRQLPKVDDESIEALARARGDIPVLQVRIDLQHALHTYGVLKVPVDSNGRAHVNIDQHRTETQRMASGTDDEEEDKPRISGAGNIQNKKDLERSIFCAGDPNFVFWEFDWSQIELRVMAWLAREMDLLAALREKKDIHSLNAAAIFGCGESRAEADSFLIPFEGQMRPARHAAKRGTHGWDYGMGDAKTGRMYQPCATWDLQHVADFIHHRWQERRDTIGPDTLRRLLKGGLVEHARLYDYANTITARGWIEAYFKRWPKLRMFQENVVKFVEKNRYLENSFGYRLDFHNFRTLRDGTKQLADREEALALKPQSDTAFICKATLPKIKALAEEFGGECFLTNHDAFAGRTPLPRIVEFEKQGRAVMEAKWQELGEITGYGQFHCPADFMVGWNWGKKHDHGPKRKCDPEKCKQYPNPRGLVEWGEALKEGLYGATAAAAAA